MTTEQQNTVKPAEFSAIRGHVAEGTRILFHFCEATIENTMNGWRIVATSPPPRKVLADSLPSAWAVEEVVERISR